jgi:hypothetical protein
MLWCVFGSSAYSLRRGDSNGPTVVSVPGLGQQHEMKSTNCRKYMYTHHIAAVTNFRWVGLESLLYPSISIASTRDDPLTPKHAC